MAYSLLREERTLGESLHNVGVVFLGDHQHDPGAGLRGDVHGGAATQDLWTLFVFGVVDGGGGLEMVEVLIYGKTVQHFLTVTPPLWP